MSNEKEPAMMAIESIQQKNEEIIAEIEILMESLRQKNKIIESMRRLMIEGNDSMIIGRNGSLPASFTVDYMIQGKINEVLFPILIEHVNKLNKDIKNDIEYAFNNIHQIQVDHGEGQQAP